MKNKNSLFLTFLVSISIQIVYIIRNINQLKSMDTFNVVDIPMIIYIIGVVYIFTILIKSNMNKCVVLLICFTFLLLVLTTIYKVNVITHCMVLAGLLIMCIYTILNILSVSNKFENLKVNKSLLRFLPNITMSKELYQKKLKIEYHIVPIVAAFGVVSFFVFLITLENIA